MQILLWLSLSFWWGNTEAFSPSSHSLQTLALTQQQHQSQSMLRRSTVAAILTAQTRFYSILPSTSASPRPQLSSSIVRNRLSFSMSSDPNNTNNVENTDESEVVRTGWTHNQPKRWTSEEAAAASTTSSSTPTTTTTEIRTGWLHNTDAPKPTTSAEAAKKNGETLAQRLLRLEKLKKRINHRIITSPTFHSCGGSQPMMVTAHKISVPLHRTGAGDKNEDEETVDVFFTIAEKVKADDEVFFKTTLSSLSPTQRASEYVQHAGMKDAMKMILYLQGGPGFGAPTPITGLGLEEKCSWAAAALNKEGFDRVVLMDQRGTGRSTPITKQTLERKFPDLFILDDKESTTHQLNVNDYDDTSIDTSLAHWNDAEPETYATFSSALDRAVNYMAQFRADNIVKDAEEIKNALLLPIEDINDDDDANNTSEDSKDENTPRPWGAALGQSFGGFCMMSYLSLIPHPPKICLLTGGIAPMLSPPMQVYQSLFERVKERNFLYYDMYPSDIQVVHRIVSALHQNPAPLPSGGMLTARRFLQVGISLGGSPSSFASLHSLFATAMLDNDCEDENEEPQFSRAFLKHMDSLQPFDDYPIYFLMHESIYADAQRFGATQWAAHRAYQERTRTPDDFSYQLTSQMKSDARPTLFTTEMVFPWMADGDFAEVSGLGMKSLAHALARKDDWGPLYDEKAMKHALTPSNHISKAAAAVYFDDMYVDFDECMKVARARDSPLGHCKMYITNDYQHSGLRDDGANIFSKILGMARGTIRTPS